MLIMCLPRRSVDIRYFNMNQLTALDVGLFDKNTALRSLYVRGGECDVRNETSAVGGWVGVDASKREMLVRRCAMAGWRKGDL
jgi:hypothetical protein